MSKSLGEVHSSVPVKNQGKFFMRLLAFSGPAFMVSVGYMDPGNWATDLAGGARFGYKLIWVILMANLMAILFQTLASRLGVVTGRDLAQACRDHYSKPVSYLLWIVCEVAIAACDLAEVLGSAIGLYLLFNIPLLWGVVITTVDVLLLMLLINLGIRKMEAFILALVTTIGVCFALQMFLAKPAVAEIMTGFIPTGMNSEALFIALGIIGATVMPHNLYLHSALVQSRKVSRTKEGLKEANKFNLIDSVVALNGAFFVNAAILVLAASVFYKNGLQEVASIIDAHSLLAPLLGTGIAPIAFGIALLAAGQSSTITGTFAGQIVMEGFIGLKVRPWLRRLITRSIAVVPAVIVISFYGNNSVDALLILSQVILSLQLPFAMIPLLHFTSDKEKMGTFASKPVVKILAWVSASFIILLNLKFVIDLISDKFYEPGVEGLLVRFVLFPVSIFMMPLLAYVVAEPFIRKARKPKLQKATLEPITPAHSLPSDYKRIGIAMEGNTGRDMQIINQAMPFLKAVGADLHLIHCVQTVPALYYGNLVADSTAINMQEYLEHVAVVLRSDHFDVTVHIGGGEPEDEILRVISEHDLNLIIAGSHGHKFITDLIYGSTIEGVRHKSRLPVLAIPVEY
ncbi:MAG: Nramp family divalent metal transporter [Ignavibacteriales bacterium]|nr:Nramp family divalent metal transporter [Ignavibacteriales bacterium]